MLTTFDATSTVALPCKYDSASGEQEPIDMEEAFDELALNVQVGYRTCSQLVYEFGGCFDWNDLSGTDIFEIAIENDSLVALIDEGLSSGLAREDIVDGIDSAACIWATAQDFADRLLQGIPPLSFCRGRDVVVHGLFDPKTFATKPHWAGNSPLLDIRVQRARCDF